MSPGRRSSSVSSNNSDSSQGNSTGLTREARGDKVRKYWEKKKRRKS